MSRQRKAFPPAVSNLRARARKTRELKRQRREKFRLKIQQKLLERLKKSKKRGK